MKVGERTNEYGAPPIPPVRETWLFTALSVMTRPLQDDHVQNLLREAFRAGKRDASG